MDTTTPDETSTDHPMIGAAFRAAREHLSPGIPHEKANVLARLYDAHRDAERIGGDYGDGRVAGLRLAVSLLLGCTHDEARAVLRTMRRDKAAG